MHCMGIAFVVVLVVVFVVFLIVVCVLVISLFVSWSMSALYGQCILSALLCDCCFVVN
jgi:hypothetical protein